MKNAGGLLKGYFRDVKDAVIPGRGLLRASVMAGKNKVYCMLVNETCGQKEFLQSVSMDTDCDIYNNAYTAGGNTGRIG